ncbi:MAG: response regulator [Chloroflexi bacterium]|nr:response regulator [Chloroflexota bacterium]MBU1749085.1 response regulator [Chloroflexota bacterium]MBU1877594.1 response regulator [Chloroflexota bacterium]
METEPKTWRVLVIDDQQVVRRYLQMMLQRAGYDVLLASDGQKGIQVLEDQGVDLVLTDLKMPILDGYDVLRYVQQSSRPVPVILMTAYGSPGVEAEARRLGAWAYLSKPFEFEVLDRVLKQAVGLAVQAR